VDRGARLHGKVNLGMLSLGSADSAGGIWLNMNFNSGNVTFGLGRRSPSHLSKAANRCRSR